MSLDGCVGGRVDACPEAARSGQSSTAGLLKVFATVHSSADGSDVRFATPLRRCVALTDASQSPSRGRGEWPVRRAGSVRRGGSHRWLGAVGPPLGVNCSRRDGQDRGALGALVGVGCNVAVGESPAASCPRLAAARAGRQQVRAMGRAHRMTHKACSSVDDAFMEAAGQQWRWMVERALDMREAGHRTHASARASLTCCIPPPQGPDDVAALSDHVLEICAFVALGFCPYALVTTATPPSLMEPHKHICALLLADGALACCRLGERQLCVLCCAAGSLHSCRHWHIPSLFESLSTAEPAHLHRLRASP
jgi:hypothetical protein